ncbi:MAG: acetate--CoA ligase family protein [Sphingomonadaceae bacterium]
MAETQPSPTNPDIRAAGLAKVDGFLFGMTQRCLMATIEIAPGVDLAALAGRLENATTPYRLELDDALPLENIAGGDDASAAFAVELARAVRGLQEAAGIPVCGAARLNELHALADGIRRMVLFLPSFHLPSAALALEAVLGLGNTLVAAPQGSEIPAQQQQALDALMMRLRGNAPGGNNTRHLIRAAHGLGIACRVLPLGVLQLGIGKSSRLFNSTSTDATSVIGTIMARNKLAATEFMRRADIPVPVTAAAPSAEAAVAAAKRIGFPVVVKPVDEERGRGVSTNLCDEEAVRQAHAKARRLSPNILVQKHIDGSEYRMLVVNGKLFWAFERAPAQVTGDGKQSVTGLIEATNSTRRDGRSTGLHLMKIVVDDALVAVLEGQGLTLESIPEAGQRVRLRTVPLVMDGGELIPVFDQVHPDNREMAERIARLLRLDIAGIDFLTPDISRSWREVGGGVTEANSQPQFSPMSRHDIYEVMLGELVPNRGRVPVALVIGEDTADLQAAVRDRLASAGMRAGLASDRKILIGSERVSQGRIDPFHAADLLATDPAVEAIVLFSDGREILRKGIPFERFDLLVVDGKGEVTPEQRRMLSLVHPHLDGPVIAVNRSPLAELVARTLGPDKARLAGTRAEVAAKLCSAVQAIGQTD